MSAVKRICKTKGSMLSKKAKKSDLCSRVGSNYQVLVPDFAYGRSDNYLNEHCELEINVWNPNHNVSLSDVDKYLMEAEKYRYSEESAGALLHYHKYNTQNAADDLPNHQPILNTYSKLEIKNFLKCVDSRPRKNFVNVKESFPAYGMGELQALYYAIAAPFKAIPRHNRKHGRQMQSCYEKALRCGFTAFGAAPIPILPEVVDLEEIEVDGLFERYLYGIVDHDRANKILAGVRRGRSITNASTASNVAEPLCQHYYGITNGALLFGRRCIATTNATELLLGNSDRSPSLESHSRLRAINPSPPAIATFDDEKFDKFMKTPPDELERWHKDWKAALLSLDDKLKIRTELIDSQNKHIFEGLDSLFPSKGFSSISYRWTKSELALLVMALDEYGQNFGQVARILGTKTEGLVRDFYNKYKDVFNLDVLAIKANERLEETNETPENEITYQPEVGSVISDSIPPSTVALSTQVKHDPEMEASLLNGELKAASKGSISELEPLFVGTASLSPNTDFHTSTDTPSAFDNMKISVAPAFRPIACLKRVDHYSLKLPQSDTSSPALNQCTQNSEAEVGKVEEEDEGKRDTAVKKKASEKKSKRAVNFRRERRQKGFAKEPPPEIDTRTLITAKRRYLQHLNKEDELTRPSRRSRVTNPMVAESPVKSRTQTRGITRKTLQLNRWTRSRKQNHKLVGTSLNKVTLKRSRRRQSEAGRDEKEASGKNGKNDKVVKPKVVNRQRISLNIPASLTSGSPKRRTRASIPTTSFRFSIRQLR